ncbi:MAG: hypothetical protein AB7O57_11090 [Hyphomicrobiaceae bacterium]
MNGLDIALRLVGAFYVLGGALLVRAVLSVRMLDAAIATISAEKPGAGSDGRALWHLANAVLLFAGGLALMLLSDLAVWLFVTSLAGQALYLFWLAPAHFDRLDAPDELGRRQSLNAFAIYAAATALVVWGWWRARLVHWRDEPWEMLAAAGAAIAVLIGYIVLAWRRPLGPDRHSRTPDGDDHA